MGAIKTLWALAPSLFIVLVYAGVAAAPVEIGEWFGALSLPSFAPSAHCATCIWAVCYLADVIALCAAIKRKRGALVAMTTSAGVLGAVWSFVFFSLQNVKLAAVIAVIIALVRIVSTVACTRDLTARLARAIAAAACVYLAVVACSIV